MSYQSVKALLAKGVSRPTLFQVMITDLGREANDQLNFLCKTASVPEVAVNTLAVNGQESMGMIREQATMVTYAKPFSITVVSDRDYTVYKAMREWFDTHAINANPRQSVIGFDINGSNQRMSYYDTVKKQITLKKLEYGGEEERYYQPFQIDFNDAYPVRLGALELDTESRDALMMFNVDFTYENYTIDMAPSTVEYE